MTDELDKMLDDLKTTVNTDGDGYRRDAYNSSFRSSSRSESRNSNKAVEDAGLMKHHHKEYTSPDKTTRIITDEFEYDSGDPTKAGQYHKKVKKSTYSSYKVKGSISDELDALKQGPSQATIDANTPDPKDQVNPISANPATKITNGDMDVVDDGAEVRRIVWRNRFEKSETNDASTPTMTIEDDSYRTKLKKYEIHSHEVPEKTVAPVPPQRGPVSPRTLQLQYAVYWPSPNISPGGQPWVDPIPLPTPPPVSQGEPGVAYVYSYGENSESNIQHLPPLNYVAGPPKDGMPATTPSGQPVIYHYSYHYTLQPGQTPGDHLPPGIHQMASSSQPSLQLAPTPRKHSFKETVLNPENTNTSYNYSSSFSRNEKTSTSANDTYATPIRTGSFPRDLGDDSPSLPRRGDPSGPNSNMSITINKTTTHTSHTKEYAPGPSPSPTRYTKTGFSYTSPGDSLERLKKPYQPSKPFPETSPVQHPSDEKIPRHVDDLMTSFDGQERIYRETTTTTNTTTTRPPYMSNGIRQPEEHEPLILNRRPERKEEIEIKETAIKTDLPKKEESKNLAGPPVYYPPGHNQLFDESMHTMTLKEDKRRGMAKWRRERAEYEKASHSESKGGGAMVPVCLPLCCGAACVLM